MALTIRFANRMNRIANATAGSKSGDFEIKLHTANDRKHLDKPRTQHSFCIILSFCQKKTSSHLTCFFRYL